MQLDCLALDHLRLEGLDTQSVKGRCTVQEHGVTLHYVLQDVPDNGILAIYNLLCALYGLYDTALDQFPDDERFVKLCCHELRQTALVHIEFRTYNDNGTGRIVYTFTEEVLTEASLLTLEAVRKALESTVALALDCA